MKRFLKPTFFALAIVIVAAAVAAVIFVQAVRADSAPKISNVEVADTSATSTTVTWTTNVKTDSFVNYSEDTNYCGIRNAGDLTLSHSVTIPNLVPGTMYYFRVRATDAQANQSYSGDYAFTTKSTVSTSSLAAITNTSQKNLASQAISAISQLTNAAALTAVSQAVSSQGEAALGPPNILGEPIVDASTSQATIQWNTDQDSNSVVYIAAASDYNQDPSNPYTRTEGNQSESVTDHTVTIYGLSPATTYHYKVSSQATVGPAGESSDYTFTTKSILPEILSPRLVKVEEHDATIAWATPFPTAGTVEYTNMSTRQTLSAGDPTFLASHMIQLNNLVFQTRYSVVIKATNQAGDSVTSQPLYFVTTKDVTPPVISQVTNNSTLYPGQDTTVQTIVSWATDEPATCDMSYVQGIVKNASDTITTPMETGFLTKHVAVVTDFTPATVYKYWVTCSDQDGNTTSSADFVLLTPQQQKSIIDIILSNFQGTFGWLGNFTGGGGGGSSGGQ